MHLLKVLKHKRSSEYTIVYTDVTFASFFCRILRESKQNHVLCYQVLWEQFGKVISCATGGYVVVFLLTFFYDTMMSPVPEYLEKIVLFLAEILFSFQTETTVRDKLNMLVEEPFSLFEIVFLLLLAFEKVCEVKVIDIR